MKVVPLNAPQAGPKTVREHIEESGIDLDATVDGVLVLALNHSGEAIQLVHGSTAPLRDLLAMIALAPHELLQTTETL